MTDPTINPSELAGKLALVTGAQQGIGREAALRLAACGAEIIASYPDDDVAAQQLLEAVANTGSRCHLVRADLSSRAQIATLLAAVDAIGVVSILVNNAAIFPRQNFLQVSASLWDEVQAINLTAPFLLTQHVARALVDKEMQGSIINITSGAAFRGTPRGSHYVTSKAGLVGLTRATAQELASAGIRVNAVAPGLTDTAQPRHGMTESEIDAAADDIPMGRIADAADIASVICFLASDAAAYMTGQTVHVNGGSYLS